MKGLPRKCLPLDFMGIYGLCGLETDKACLQAFKRFVLTDVVKRMDCIKSISLSGGGWCQYLSAVPNYQPRTGSQIFFVFQAWTTSSCQA